MLSRLFDLEKSIHLLYSGPSPINLIIGLNPSFLAFNNPSKVSHDPIGYRNFLSMQNISVFS